MALRLTTQGPPIRANNMEPEVYRQALAGLSHSGGVVLAGDFAASQHAGTPGMSVDVAAGTAFVTGTSVALTQGTYTVLNDAATQVTVTAADGTNPRIDRLIVQVQDNYVDSSGANAPRFVVVAGTPAPSPALPSLGAYPNSVEIAQIAVGAAVTSILNANITDVRPFHGTTNTGIRFPVLQQPVFNTPPAGTIFTPQCFSVHPTSSAGVATITYPTAAPNGVYQIFLTVGDNENSLSQVQLIKSTVSLTQCQAGCFTNNGTAISNSLRINVLMYHW